MVIVLVASRKSKAPAKKQRVDLRRMLGDDAKTFFTNRRQKDLSEYPILQRSYFIYNVRSSLSVISLLIIIKRVILLT